MTTCIRVIPTKTTTRISEVTMIVTVLSLFVTGMVLMVVRKVVVVRFMTIEMDGKYS